MEEELSAAEQAAASALARDPKFIAGVDQLHAAARDLVRAIKADGGDFEDVLHEAMGDRAAVPPGERQMFERLWNERD